MSRLLRALRRYRGMRCTWMESGMDTGGEIMSQLRHQLGQDVERLRKAADSIEQILCECERLNLDRAVAVESLKIIATWASCPRIDRYVTDSQQIRSKALDALQVMREHK